ncbi:hypothetical protein [Maribacter sp. 2307ULW6-5]|uniref:hypothetical protein n=1 Tax=Maribacter sp. 2307ULW6-5 TaxID=3386275 RepID=UPI0039BD00A4
MIQNSNLVSVAALLFNSAFSGAFLFIAVTIVPFWSSLEPSGVNAWYATYFWRFPTIMVPLNLLTFIAIAIGTYRAHKVKSPNVKLWYLAFVAIFLCSLTYPLIFDGANKTMMSPNANLQEVAASFQKWVDWHRVRTLLSLISLGLMTYITARPPSK